MKKLIKRLFSRYCVSVFRYERDISFIYSESRFFVRKSKAQEFMKSETQRLISRDGNTFYNHLVETENWTEIKRLSTHIKIKITEIK